MPEGLEDVSRYPALVRIHFFPFTHFEFMNLATRSQNFTDVVGIETNLLDSLVEIFFV